MKRALLLLALAATGCATVGRVAHIEARVDALEEGKPQWDETPFSASPRRQRSAVSLWAIPGASAPIASVGNWVPVQAAKQATVAAGLAGPGLTFGGAVMLSGAQTAAGDKTFSGNITINPGTFTVTAGLTTLSGGTNASNYFACTGVIYARGNAITDDNASTLTFNDGVADGAGNIAFAFNSTTSLTTTAKLASFKNNTVEKAYIQQDGMGSFSGGVSVGGGTTITKILRATSVIDFTSTTTTCNDSSGITVTGATTNSECFVGPPTSGGSTNATYSCYASAADTVKVRHCAAGTADDPASATYAVIVFVP